MRERLLKRQKSVFCNLITEVTSQYSCHILLVKSKSLGPAHSQGKGIAQWCKYQEGDYWSHFRSSLPYDDNNNNTYLQILFKG